MVKVVIIGAAGRMGQALVRGARRLESVLVAGAVERADCPALGKDAGLLAGEGEMGIAIVSDLSATAAKGDVLIDFSFHAAVPTNVRAAVELRKAMVIGTTGLTPEEKAVLVEAAKRIPIVHAPNMSLGGNLLFSLVREAARVLGQDYDCEIVEVHHRFKKDAPSGTALRLAEKAAEGRGQDLKAVAVYGREGITGERPRGQIGIHALRCGDVVGDHTVEFSTLGERVQLTHRATSRDCLATGALKAAEWVAGRAPGLYDMQDVLGV